MIVLSNYTISEFVYTMLFYFPIDKDIFTGPKMSDSPPSNPKFIYGIFILFYKIFMNLNNKHNFSKCNIF